MAFVESLTREPQVHRGPRVASTAMARGSAAATTCRSHPRTAASKRNTDSALHGPGAQHRHRDGDGLVTTPRAGAATTSAATTFWSSRTLLPGQACRQRLATASGPRDARVSASAREPPPERVAPGSGTSSIRSRKRRSTWMRITASRNRRSSRNRAARHRRGQPDVRRADNDAHVDRARRILAHASHSLCAPATHAGVSLLPPVRARVRQLRRQEERAPPWASSKRPGRGPTAPVKAPRTCPNISDSISSSVSAAQFTAQNRRSRRALSRWSARATMVPCPCRSRLR